MTKYCKGFNCSTKEQHKRPLLGQFKKAFWIFAIIVFITTAFVYLFQINTIAAKGFEIKELEQQISVAQEEIETLQLKAIELKSMSGLDEKVKDLGMIEVDKITYFDTTDQFVVRKD